MSERLRKFIKLVLASCGVLHSTSFILTLVTGVVVIVSVSCDDPCSIVVVIVFCDDPCSILLCLLTTKCIQYYCEYETNNYISFSNVLSSHQVTKIQYYKRSSHNHYCNHHYQYEKINAGQ